MLKREITPRDAYRTSLPVQRKRTGSAVMGAFAGVAVLSVGTTAAALAATHSSVVQAAAGTVCQTLPAGASSPPGSPTSTASVSAGPNSPMASSSPTQLCVDAEPVAGI